MSDLIPLFGLVAAAVAIYVLRERRRRRTEIRPRFPGITMEEALAIAPVDGDTRELLLEIERRALASDNPRLAIRNAILRHAAVALHLEAIAALGEDERRLLLKGYEPGMDALLRTALESSEAAWRSLREYARLKYDDAVPGDWFDRFLHQARPYIREKVRLARDYLLQLDPAAGRFAEIYDALLQELREGSLAAPAKKRFPPPDVA
ncbi:MAG: hypothetical protein ACE15B_16920 [Bryobacteraceae bacterium]